MYFFAHITLIIQITKKEIAVAIAAPCAPIVGIINEFKVKLIIAAVTVEIANILLFLTAVNTLPKNPLRALKTSEISNTEEYSQARKKSLANNRCANGMFNKIRPLHKTTTLFQQKS